MQKNNPYDAYHKTNVNTADQRQLILMLYDGAIRYMKKSVTKIEGKDYEAAHNYLVRSREIVAELLATLRPEKGGEVGENLKRLYVYVFNKLVEANLLKDADMVEEAINILGNLREGWAAVKSPATKPALGITGEGRKVRVTM